jgi:predicted alpha/beta-fold hydrolase
VSLGGNALLKWLGERGEAAGFVRGAAAVCPPQDLHAGALALSRGLSLGYARHFLASLKRKSLGKLAQHPGLFDRERMLASRDFFDFDEFVTAPMHGFAGCMDYWQRSSCRQFLGGIRVPTRILNALNDPFLPPAALARPGEVAPCVRLHYTAGGGHVGFHAGPPRRASRWLADYLLESFDAPR